jgi:hypothetical protein
VLDGTTHDPATLTNIPSDPSSTMANEEWRINTQLRLGLPLASYHNKPHEPCPHGCRHPQTIPVRYGCHLVTDCRKANQGNKSHKDVQSILIHYFNTFTHITATKARPFPNGKQAERLIGHHDHRQPNLKGPLIPSVLPIKRPQRARTTTDPNSARLGTAQCAQVRTSNDSRRGAESAGVRMRPSGRVARVAKAVPSVI